MFETEIIHTPAKLMILKKVYINSFFKHKKRKKCEVNGEKQHFIELLFTIWPENYLYTNLNNQLYEDH